MNNYSIYSIIFSCVRSNILFPRLIVFSQHRIIFPRLLLFSHGYNPRGEVDGRGLEEDGENVSNIAASIQVLNITLVPKVL